MVSGVIYFVLRVLQTSRIELSYHEVLEDSLIDHGPEISFWLVLHGISQTNELARCSNEMSFDNDCSSLIINIHPFPARADNGVGAAMQANGTDEAGETGRSFFLCKTIIMSPRWGRGFHGVSVFSGSFRCQGREETFGCSPETKFSLSVVKTSQSGMLFSRQANRRTRRTTQPRIRQVRARPKVR